MTFRNFVRRVHLAAGIIAFAAIFSFWTATVVTEVIGDRDAITLAKQAILWGMILLIPAMAAAGGSGFRLGGRNLAPIIVAKRRRMIVIAANGLLVLVPSAFFLAGRAAAGNFDAAFIAVQAVELAAGAINIVLMGLNLRDGLHLTAKRRAPPAGAPA